MGLYESYSKKYYLLLYGMNELKRRFWMKDENAMIDEWLIVRFRAKRSECMHECMNAEFR